jgi:transcriptional regulator with XRE-family HTH domain
MDDVRVGRSLRLLRQRRGLTQAQLAARAAVSQQLVSLVERGHLDALAIRSIRRLFGALDARFDAHVSWRGGQLDRLLDAAHAELVGRCVDRLRPAGWEVEIEVSYSVYGERGSIDLLAGRRADRAALVVEVKSELASIEELARKTDEKTRLARTVLCRERFGFEPTVVGRLLVVPERDRIRRSLAAHAVVLDVLFPARGREMRVWLRQPNRSVRGILVLRGGTSVRSTNAGGTPHDQRGALRVQTARPGAN